MEDPCEQRINQCRQENEALELASKQLDVDIGIKSEENMRLQRLLITTQNHLNSELKSTQEELRRSQDQVRQLEENKSQLVNQLRNQPESVAATSTDVNCDELANRYADIQRRMESEQTELLKQYKSLLQANEDSEKMIGELQHNLTVRSDQLQELGRRLEEQELQNTSRRPSSRRQSEQYNSNDSLAFELGQSPAVAAVAAGVADCSEHVKTNERLEMELKQLQMDSSLYLKNNTRLEKENERFRSRIYTWMDQINKINDLERELIARHQNQIAMTKTIESQKAMLIALQQLVAKLQELPPKRKGGAISSTKRRPYKKPTAKKTRRRRRN